MTEKDTVRHPYQEHVVCIYATCIDSGAVMTSSLAFLMIDNVLCFLLRISSHG